MIQLLEIDTEAGTLSVVGSGGRRPPSQDEVETVRDALPAPRMPTGIEVAAIVIGMAAFSYVAVMILGGQ